jgi:hypothetical protein
MQRFGMVYDLYMACQFIAGRSCFELGITG